jgi:hypothetical protein
MRHHFLPLAKSCFAKAVVARAVSSPTESAASAPAALGVGCDVDRGSSGDSGRVVNAFWCASETTAAGLEDDRREGRGEADHDELGRSLRSPNSPTAK